MVLQVRTVQMVQTVLKDRRDHRGLKEKLVLQVLMD